MPTATTLRCGTRASALARWQTGRIAGLLRDRAGLACETILLSTEGDRRLDVPLPEIGGKGVFTQELEAALREGSIDFAVHSLKDLPIEPAEGLVLAAVLLREDARDVLVGRPGGTLATLAPGARVGTSSTRRMAQLRAARPDLSILPLRGNVDTRVRKARDGEYDAIVIAAAGLIRLGLAGAITEYLPYEIMLPAPGQGALAVQCRADDERTRELLAPLDEPAVRAATGAERAFLEALGGGCAAPVAALARPTGAGATEFRLRCLVGSTDGSRVLRVEGTAPAAGLTPLALRLAADVIARGGRELLA